MNYYQSAESIGPHSIPRLGRRPAWDFQSIIRPEITSARDAAMAITSEWNMWADRTEIAFRNLYSQSYRLEVTDQDYMGFIHMISEHPARPELASGETYENSHDDADQDFGRVPLIELHMSWESYADALEETYMEIVRRLSQYKEDWCNGDLSLATMSLTPGPSESGSVRGVLGLMLGPGRSFHRGSEKTYRKPTSSQMDTEVQQERVVKCSNQNYDSLQGGTAAQAIENVRIQDLCIKDQEMEDCDI